VIICNPGAAFFKKKMDRKHKKLSLFQMRSKQKQHDNYDNTVGAWVEQGHVQCHIHVIYVRYLWSHQHRVA
jgi:hypothetical protein